MRHFQAKMSKIFGRGHSPLPDTVTTPTGEGNRPTPDQTPRPSAPQRSTPSKFVPNFYHYAIATMLLLTNFETESSASFVSRSSLGLLSGTRLEVGPVNIQSSRWINLLMQFVMDWHTPANSIINIQHSFCITYDIYTSKHIFYDHSVKYYVQMCRKVTKIVATRCQILRLKCTKFDSAPDPTVGAYSAPPDLLAGFKGSYF